MSQELTSEQTTEVLMLDFLAAVERGKSFEAVAFYLSLQAEFEGLVTYQLTEKGRARLTEALVKLSEENCAAFRAQGVKAEFLRVPPQVDAKATA